jgi:phage host-nuclease inhibitor protein Gam
MPPVKLADTRLMTLEGAKQCLEQIAHAECRIASKRARYEKTIAAAKSRCEAETADDTRHIQDREQLLTAFILGHAELFTKPRAVKTEFGSFGLRTVSNVEVYDEEALLQLAADNGYGDVVETVRRLRKDAVRKRLEAGEDLPGARVSRGEEAFYKIDKSLLESATTLAGEPVSQATGEE